MGNPWNYCMKVQGSKNSLFLKGCCSISNDTWKNGDVLETIEKTDYKLARTQTFLPKDTIYIFKLKGGKE
jgi:hypothetical protein